MRSVDAGVGMFTGSLCFETVQTTAINSYISGVGLGENFLPKWHSASREVATQIGNQGIVICHQPSQETINTHQLDETELQFPN